MLQIPDFTKNGKTSIDCKPRCVDIRPRRKAPSKDFIWTVILQWSLEGDQVAKMLWPKQLRKFRDEILRSFNADDETLDPLQVKRGPSTEIEVALAVSTGMTHLPAVPAVKQEEGKPLPMVPAVFKSISLNVTKNVCRVKVVLEVTGSRDMAPWFCDLLDADVTAEFRAQGGLFDDEEESDEDEEDEDPPGGDGPDPVGELEKQQELEVEPPEKPRDLNPPAPRRRVTRLPATPPVELVTTSETLPPEPS